MEHENSTNSIQEKKKSPKRVMDWSDLITSETGRQEKGAKEAVGILQAPREITTTDQTVQTEDSTVEPSSAGGTPNDADSTKQPKRIPPIPATRPQIIGGIKKSAIGIDVVGCNSRCIDEEIPAEVSKYQLPNLILSTSYALNKSSSKNITVGLEYSGGQFKETLLLTGTAGKCLKFSKRSWLEITKCFDVIDAYFGNAQKFQEYGNPAKLYLAGMDVIFTTSYNKKSVIFEERPVSCSENGYDDNGPSAKKMRKYIQPPTAVMQETTFEGLKRLESCINLKLLSLTKSIAFCNNVIDSIVSFFEEEYPVHIEPSTLKNFAEFKVICTRHMEELRNYLDRDSDPDRCENPVQSLIFSEIMSFSMLQLSKHLCFRLLGIEAQYVHL